MKIGKIQPVEITAEMKQSYLDYAMSVIVQRALPDVRDGLKPVHRRILYAMHGMGQSHTASYTKSAKVVGECFIEDTLVLTQNGLKPIQSVDQKELVYTHCGLKPVTGLYVMPPRSLLTVTLENGLKNTVTVSQKFKVIDRDWNFCWKEAKDLRQGDYLVIKTTSPANIAKPVKLIRTAQNQPRFLNENIAWLLGLYLADGWFSADYGRSKHHRFSLTAGNSPKIAQKIISVFSSEFGYQIKTETRKQGNNQIYNFRVNRLEINHFFERNFHLAGKKAARKEIPAPILISPASVVFAFISGLIDGDGFVSTQKNRIQYTTVSEKLVEQLQILLHHQGIFSSRYSQPPARSLIKGKIVRDRHLVHSLEIRSLSARKLAQNITLSEERKAGRLAGLKTGVTCGREKFDQVPFAGHIAFSLMSQAHLGGGWYQDKATGEKFRTGLKYASGTKIRYSSDLARKPLHRSQMSEWGITKKLARISPATYQFLKDIEEHQIYFLRIASVTPAKPQTTYDLQVKDDHEFVANGMIVHNCMGKYHPHGDQAIYDAMVRMAQNFSMRYPLVDGHGNFGSVDGDPPAAMRYTEVRLEKITAEMLADIDKSTVPFSDNFDGSLKEPRHLPSKLPNLLLMGGDGIAVGMATKIPPHNLGEVVNALQAMLEKGEVVKPQDDTQKEAPFQIKKIKFEEDGFAVDQVKLPKTSFASEITIEELLSHIKGPDFPTGGEIYDQAEIAQAYLTGKGKIVMRAEAEISEDKKGRFQIIVHEIPYQVNKATLIAKIADLHKDKKIRDISGLRDESDQRGMRIVIELKKTAKPKSVLNSLFKHTALQTSYPANMVALVDGTPQTLNLKQILTEFIKHRQEVITRRTFFELAEAKKRAHILEGYKIALDNLDEVISTIRRSRDAASAKTNLIKKFGFTDAQATAILELQLRRLAALERQKIEDEYKQIMKQISYLTDLLENPAKILTVVSDELAQIKSKYADPRRTKVFKQSLKDFSQADLVPRESTLVTVTRTGYIKRMPPATYRAQRRGGKGVMGMTTKDEDEISQIFTANTHDRILFFTNQGRVFSVKAWELSEGSRASRGQAVVNLIDLRAEELVQAIINLKEDQKDGYLFMTTHKGRIKKTKMEEFAAIRANGLIAIKLVRGDRLCWVQPTTGEDQILLVSHKGKSIRFKESDARPMGRDTMGVRGINLKKDDFVVGMEIIPGVENIPADKRRKHFRDILVIMEKGLGKRTPVKQYPIQRRGGIGVKAANVTPKTGKIVGAHMVTEDIDQVVLTSKKAQIIKLPLKNIPTLGRDTQGVILMRFSKAGDQVAAMAFLEK